MLWALLFSLLFGNEQPNVLMDGDKKPYVKKSISNEEDRDKALTILNEYVKNDLKAFEKSLKKRRKAMKEDYQIRESSSSILLRHYRDYEVELVAVQLTSIKGHQDILSLMSDDDWKRMISMVDEDSVKLDKQFVKMQKKAKKQDTRVQKVVMRIVDDEGKADKITEVFTSYGKERLSYIDHRQESTAVHNEVLRNKGSSEEEIAKVFGDINKRRSTLFGKYVDIRQLLQDELSEKEWKKLTRRSASYY